MNIFFFSTNIQILIMISFENIFMKYEPNTWDDLN